MPQRKLFILRIHWIYVSVLKMWKFWMHLIHNWCQIKIPLTYYRNIPPKAKDDDCRSPGTKILAVKQMKADSDHPEEFLSITENVIWMHREVHKYVELLIGIQLATEACIKRRSHVFTFSWQFFKKIDKMLSASTASQH